MVVIVVMVVMVVMVGLFLMRVNWEVDRFLDGIRDLFMHWEFDLLVHRIWFIYMHFFINWYWFFNDIRHFLFNVIRLWYRHFDMNRVRFINFHFVWFVNGNLDLDGEKGKK